jgi:hypothetical protein
MSIAVIETGIVKIGFFLFQNALEWLRKEDKMPMMYRLISDTRLAAVIGVAIAVTAAV